MMKNHCSGCFGLVVTMYVCRIRGAYASGDCCMDGKGPLGDLLFQNFYASMW